MLTRPAAEAGMATLTALFGAVTMLGAIEYGVGWSDSGPEPGAFPFWIGLLVLVASLGNGIAGLRKESVELVSREQLRLVLGFALPILAFVVLSLFLGLYVGTALYMLGTLVLQNGYSPWRAVPIAVALPLFFYVVIERTFYVPLLKGPLEAMLGL